MSKECPSCCEDADEILQCRNDQCRMMYCANCAPLPGLSFLLPGRTLECPKCGASGNTVSVDDD